MSLKPGSRLGNYEIIALIGAGGMGEVYKARDPKLNRLVAIKVLPQHLSQSPEALARFEREAKAVATLNHPNLVGIHDFAQDGDTPFVVMELLEGESLRTRLDQGPLPLRRATEFGLQVAQGLAAAHAKGVIHRDLKPDNLWLTREGRIKILDFGLAKQLPAMTSGPGSVPPTEAINPSTMTGQGQLLGTVGYMSPEQVRGEAVDARSDLFSFGTVLFEMVKGRRAFAQASQSDTLAAILRDEPDLDGAGPGVPAALRLILDHCLEKDPANRFQSARDLAFALQALDGSVADPAGPGPRPGRAPGPRGRLPLIAAALLLALLGGLGLGRRQMRRPEANVTFEPRSFQDQAIFRAAFLPDGESIVYSAARFGQEPELYLVRPEYPEPQALGWPDTHLLAVSSKGELAVLLKANFMSHRLFTGTLARMTLGGTAPREILEKVQEADWTPDGADLAIIRGGGPGGTCRLEYPVGKVLLETTGYLSDLRFSPKGDRIALFEHPTAYDDQGAVIVVDLAGRRKVLASGWESEEGLTWSPDGNEILFSAARTSSIFTIYGVDLTGRLRIAQVSPGGLTIQDQSRQGHWLVTRDDKTYGMSALTPGASAERDLTWQGDSSMPKLSRDGRLMAFTDFGSLNYLACIRKTDGGPVLRLGEGSGRDLSPDGKQVAAILYSLSQVVVYPTGAGEPLRLDRGSLERIQGVHWFPDGKQVLIQGNEPGRGAQCFIQDLRGGPPRPVTPEGTYGGLAAPDGHTVLITNRDYRYELYALTGGPAKAVPGLTPMDRIVQWSADGRSLLLARLEGQKAHLERFDLASGRRTLLRSISQPSAPGVLHIEGVALTEDAKTYVYSYLKMLSKLFVVTGAH